MYWGNFCNKSIQVRKHQVILGLKVDTFSGNFIVRVSCSGISITASNHSSVRHCTQVISWCSVAECCSVMLCFAVCCSMLWCVAYCVCVYVYIFIMHMSMYTYIWIHIHIYMFLCTCIPMSVKKYIAAPKLAVLEGVHISRLPILLLLFVFSRL